MAKNQARRREHSLTKAECYKIMKELEAKQEQVRDSIDHYFDVGDKALQPPSRTGIMLVGTPTA